MFSFNIYFMRISEQLISQKFCYDLVRLTFPKENVAKMNEKKYINKNQKRNAFGNLRSAKSLKWGLCNIGCNLSTWANYKSTGRPWSCSVLPWSTVSRCEDTLRSPGCVPGWTGSCSPLIVPPEPPRSMTLCCSRRLRTGSARWTRWGSVQSAKVHVPTLWTFTWGTRRCPPQCRLPCTWNSVTAVCIRWNPRWVWRSWPSARCRGWSPSTNGLFLKLNEYQKIIFRYLLIN